MIKEIEDYDYNTEFSRRNHKKSRFKEPKDEEEIIIKEKGGQNGR